MTEEKYTRCPACKTVFRVTDAQLALRDGMVRCGHCQTIFDGRAEQISLAPQPVAGDDAMHEAMQGPPTVTLRSSRALEPMSPQEADARKDVTGSAVFDGTTQRSRRDPTIDRQRADTAAPAEPRRREGARRPAEPGIDYENRFTWDKPAARGPRRAWPYAVAIPLLLLLLIMQVLYHFRDALAAHWPATRPMLTAMCATTGCAVRPLRDVGALSIDASDLQVDPAHKGLLILTATVRNRAPYALAYPYLELTLTDAQDQVVVRRAFAPNEYVSGTVDQNAGLAGNGEVALKLFIDASATQQAGYRLYLFYP